MVKDLYLVNGERVNIQVALGGDMAPGERLVVGDTEGWEGLVKVEVEPIDTCVKVTPKYERDNRTWKHPIV